MDGGRPLRGSVEISGSKNATLPLMAAALLGDSPTTLRGVPDLRDIATMADMLQLLGADVSYDGGVLTIDPAGFCYAEAPYDMVRKMRASIYVMGPMLAKLHMAKVSLPGGCAIGPRPIDLHLRGFEALGAEIELKHGYIFANAGQLCGSSFNLSGPAGSSVGATCNVLLAASMAQGTSVISGAACEPEVSELATFLREMGARIHGAGTPEVTVTGVSSLQGVDHTVVTDRIEAGTFIAAAAITSGDVVVCNAPVCHMQATLSKFREIGVSIDELDEHTLHVWGSRENYRPVEINTSPYPGMPTDMQAQFMALLGLVPGTSVIREGIYADRFLHAAELNRMGADVRVSSGTAEIRGVAQLSGAQVMASDLRASAALILAGLAAEGTTEVNRVYHIDRGYEFIERKLRMIEAKIMRVSDQVPEEPVFANAQ